MRAGKKLEKWIRSQRDLFLRKLFSSRSGRSLHFRGFSDNLLEMTVKTPHGIFTIQPWEFIGRRLYVDGHWQRETVLDVLAALARLGFAAKGKCLLELGANIGTQTVYFSQAGLFARIVAVEADPENVRLLERNIQQNGFQESVSVVPNAVFDKPGILDFHIDETNRGGSSLVAGTSSGRSIKVEAQTLPQILEGNSISKGDIGLIWIDLEGIEFEILKHVSATLGNDIPIAMEFSPKFYGPEKTREFIAFIQSVYSHYCLLDGKSGGQNASSTETISPDWKQVDILLFNR